MDNDQTTAPPAPPSTPAAPAPQPAPTVTPEIQAMIDQARREAYDSGAASVRRAMQGRAAPSTPPTRTDSTPAAPATSPADALQLIALRDAFDDATADLGLQAAQRRFLREQVMAQRPADVTGFVRSFVDVWRPATAATTAPTNQQATPGALPAPTMPHAPVTASSPPPPPPPVRDDQRLLDMTPRDREAVQRRIGPIEFKRLLLSEIATVNVALGRR